MAKVVWDWAAGEGIVWVFHTPYYPQANGMVERTTAFLSVSLSPMNQNGWSEYGTQLLT